MTDFETAYEAEYKNAVESQIDSLCDAFLCDIQKDLSNPLNLNGARVEYYGSSNNMNDMIRAKFCFGFSDKSVSAKDAEKKVREFVEADLRMCEEILFVKAEERSNCYVFWVTVELLSDFCDDAFFESYYEEEI